MKKYLVTIHSPAFAYSLGVYYADSPEDAKRQAWEKHRSAFLDCNIGMLSAVEDC